MTLQIEFYFNFFKTSRQRSDKKSINVSTNILKQQLNLTPTTTIGNTIINATKYAPSTHIEFFLSTIQEGSAIPNCVAVI